MHKTSSDTVLEISWEAIQHNISYFRSLLKETTGIMFMIKASAYGTKAEMVAKKIEKNKLAEYFGVATTAEGVALRKAGIKLPIFVQNAAFSSWEDVTKYCLEPVLQNMETIRSFQSFLSDSSKTTEGYPVHLEINTGMNRFGFDVSEINELQQVLSEPKLWKIKSVMTHLSSSGDPLAKKFTLKQLEDFEAIVEKLKPYLSEDTFYHALNTDGVFNYTSHQLNMVRIGIGLYGGSELKSLKKNLRPIVRFTSKVKGVRSVSKGNTVSYKRSGKVSRQSNIAVLSLGYADGFPRTMGNGNWEVEINGKLYKTIGDICMDSCMIDLQGDLVKVGDTAIIFGGKKNIFDFAKERETITYEVMTSIGSRVERVLV